MSGARAGGGVAGGVIEVAADVVIVGSGAGGGTVAAALAPLAAAGRRVLVLEKGPRVADAELTGAEVDMARGLYEAGGAVLSARGSLCLAMGSCYGGSTAVYTGTTLPPPARVVRAWGVPGLAPEDLAARAERLAAEVSAHLLPEAELNDNNRLFRDGCRRLGLPVEQFRVNLRGCRGSSLCNLGCANGGKQGTNRVQLPRAEAAGVEVVTRAEVLRVEERAVVVRVHPRPEGGLGGPSPWTPGEYRVAAGAVVVAAGAVGTPALLLRSRLPARLPRLGHGFTCHPALVVVAEHPRPITNDVGHPKSFFLDRAVEERFVLESCMYFPFTTAKGLAGFGAEHAALMGAFPRLQMMLVLACDRRRPENRVAVDRAGRPVVHYRYTPEVVEALAAGCRAAARVGFAAGAVRVHAPLGAPPTLEAADAAQVDARVRAAGFLEGRTTVSAAHLMGGCGMGRGPDDSVTDARGRVHGLPWLYVADASLFPDALELNPYLTIMTLAERVAEAVLEALPAAGPPAAERPAATAVGSTGAVAP